MTTPHTLFTRQTRAYASARPGYPDALYDALAKLAPTHELAWDCGCGSGQATAALATHFAHVQGTDVSAEQIAQATPHARITYTSALASHAPHIADESVDLVCVATALHWFDIPAFYTEVDRTLRPGGVLAIWAYSSHQISDELDAWTAYYAREVVGEYWQKGRLNLLHDRYASLPDVPAHWCEIDPPTYPGGWRATQAMTLEHYADYLRSWSASQSYRDVRGEDPVLRTFDALRQAWGDGEETREVSWPLFMRLFRKP